MKEIKFNKSNLFPLTLKVVKWILRVYNLRYPGRLDSLSALTNRLHTMSTTRGIEETVSYIKNVRTAYLNYLAGNPVSIKGVKQTRDGLPVILGDLIATLRRSPDPVFLRLVNTILFATRALNIGRTPEISPIVRPPVKEIPNIGHFMGDFWRVLGYRHSNDRIPYSLKFRNYHMTSKSGPSGPFNAIGMAIPDFLALPFELKKAIATLGGETLKDRMNKLIDNEDFFIRRGANPSERIRKLSYFPDKENKVRVIAVGDYWSQTALRPLHNYLYSVLRKIPQDQTFDQGAGLKELALTEEWFSSVDLSNATDRFPIKVISQLLRAKLPSSYVDAWEHVMVGYPFVFNDGISETSVNYQTGNPMGFYSSWASFALAHHYIMYYLCRTLGKDWTQAKYRLLGDDIVICDKELAKEYKALILDLGMEFSPIKTYESSHFFEFAKRLYFKGVEISPFPISGLNEVVKKYYLFIDFLSQLSGKGWELPISCSQAVSEYYGEILSRPSSYKKGIEIKGFVLERVMKIARGAENAGDLLSEAFRKLGYHFILSDFVARNVLENIIVEAFAENNPTDERVREKKGFDLSMALSDLPVDNVFTFDSLVDSLAPQGETALWYPPADVYRQVMESIQELSDKGLAISQKGEDWPLLMKTMAIPWRSEVFSQRSRYMVVRAYNSISARLEDRAQILGFYPPEELLRTHG
uniref:RNA-dependent RNA polymerase n=1 Tax=Grapevine-associated mitovirus 9 TaxID=2814322 RepID=A0A8F5RC78_9VIRU|nr:MAG: RNA-dependent RNA polymerase [Grapevine-associated mitovirus 9]